MCRRCTASSEHRRDGNTRLSPLLNWLSCHCTSHQPGDGRPVPARRQTPSYSQSQLRRETSAWLSLRGTRVVKCDLALWTGEHFNKPCYRNLNRGVRPRIGKVHGFGADDVCTDWHSVGNSLTGSRCSLRCAININGDGAKWRVERWTSAGCAVHIHLQGGVGNRLSRWAGR
jgi:hypothetical protein